MVDGWMAEALSRAKGSDAKMVTMFWRSARLAT